MYTLLLARYLLSFSSPPLHHFVPGTFVARPVVSLVQETHYEFPCMHLSHLRGDNLYVLQDLAGCPGSLRRGDIYTHTYHGWLQPCSILQGTHLRCLCGRRQ